MDVTCDLRMSGWTERPPNSVKSRSQAELGNELNSHSDLLFPLNEPPPLPLRSPPLSPGPLEPLLAGAESRVLILSPTTAFGFSNDFIAFFETFRDLNHSIVAQANLDRAFLGPFRSLNDHFSFATHFTAAEDRLDRYGQDMVEAYFSTSIVTSASYRV